MSAVFLSDQDRAWLRSLITSEFQKVERLMTQVQDEITALANTVEILTATVAGLKGQVASAGAQAVDVASLQAQIAELHSQIDANNVTSDDLANLKSLNDQLGSAVATLQLITQPAPTGEPTAGADSTTEATAGNDTLADGAGNDALPPDVPPTAQ